MSQERMKEVAIELMRLGVSHDGVTQLLHDHTVEEIERQLRYLPFRKAKRPEAFIIEAIRKNYSAPKEFFHAQTPTQPAPNPLDEDPEPPAGSSVAHAQGHGAPNPPAAPEGDNGLEPGEPGDLDDLPDFDPQIR